VISSTVRSSCNDLPAKTAPSPERFGLICIASLEGTLWMSREDHVPHLRAAVVPRGRSTVPREDLHTRRLSDERRLCSQHERQRPRDRMPQILSGNSPRCHRTSVAMPRQFSGSMEDAPALRGNAVNAIVHEPLVALQQRPPLADQPLQRPAGRHPGLRGAARRSRGERSDQDITCPIGQGAR
jgi:hypothetical protein